MSLLAKLINGNNIILSADVISSFHTYSGTFLYELISLPLASLTWNSASRYLNHIFDLMYLSDHGLNLTRVRIHGGFWYLGDHVWKITKQSL